VYAKSLANNERAQRAVWKVAAKTDVER